MFLVEKEATMKFKTKFSVNMSKELLEKDLSAAQKCGKVSLGEQCLYISHTLYKEYVPYTAITKAF